MAWFVDVGQSVSRTTTMPTSRKPKWLKWTASNKLSGTVSTPTGIYQDMGNGIYDFSTRDLIVISRIDLPTTDADWRVAIFAPNGSYITSTGMGDIPTVGTPVVRLTDNAPSKAVVKYPVLKNNPGNILDSTFAGWSDGHAEAVSRGMEITVEYRDVTTASMQMVFRGQIYQIESGDAVTVTAYDRLMDLAQYSDQYQSHAGYTQADTSVSRTISGSDYVYRMNNPVGTPLSAETVDLLQIDATAQMTHGAMDKSMSRIYAHPLPSINGYTAESGKKITQVKAKIYVGVVGTRKAGTPQISTSITCTARARVILYQRIGSSMTVVASTDYQTVTCSASAVSMGASNTVEQVLSWSVDWQLSGSGYYLAFETIKDSTTAEYPTYWSFISSGAYPEYSSSRLTVTGNYYTSNDGTIWTEVSSGDLPEVAMQFTATGSSVAVGNLSVSGSEVAIAEANVPAGPSDGQYLSTPDKGIYLVMTYFLSGAMGLREVAEQLIAWAGLYPNVIGNNMGYTDYYNTSTYDYLSCVQEIISGYGIKASVLTGGVIYVNYKHNISEDPVASFTTAPDGTGEQAVIKHDLTAHWMAEKATVAYIAEDAVVSGLPIALETDDALFDDSLVDTLQTKLRTIITDNTLGTHDLMANAASGKIIKLHTNVFEGTMTLAGYRPSLWELNTELCGGMPIGIDIPEYGAQGTAIPTEIILGDGVTQVSLNNVRTPDRNEIANSMGKTEDAISNSASLIPESVYVFARIETYDEQENGLSINPTSVSLYNGNTLLATQNQSVYIKTISDYAGYNHILAVFPAGDYPSGCAPTDPITNVRIISGGNTYRANFPNAKYAYVGQNVHVDIRFKGTTWNNPFINI